MGATAGWGPKVPSLHATLKQRLADRASVEPPLCAHHHMAPLPHTLPHTMLLEQRLRLIIKAINHCPLACLCLHDDGLHACIYLVAWCSQRLATAGHI